MTIQFASSTQEALFNTVLLELEKLGYSGNLVQKSYDFEDWFLPRSPRRTVPAVAFGQTPLAYDSACFALLVPNGKTGAALVNEYRALGAPRAFEIREDKVIHWRVSLASADSDQQGVIRPEEISAAFNANADVWKPDRILQAKNIAVAPFRQKDFVDLGLVPALERHIRERLDPLLREILQAAVKEYEYRHRLDPKPEELYRLLFRVLAGKILHDRELPPFSQIQTPPDPDTLLDAVAKFYNHPQPVLADKTVRQLVVDRMWSSISFRHLSVEVLAFVWENTLVSDAQRQNLGIHATPPSIARYIVHRLPIGAIPEEERRIIEPCCGSGTFLIAALQRLRELLAPTMSPAERHQYFTERLSGFDLEPFGLEVARSCLMLADFPNPNGWQLWKEDVFGNTEASPKFHAKLEEARVVLCNPPFEDFKPFERERYQPSSVHKPVELLEQILDNLSPQGILGFVLPRQILSGAGYRSLRHRLARRFAEFEIVNLPDKVFEKSEHETALLLAKRPRSAEKTVAVLHRKIEDGDWPQFRDCHTFSREDSAQKSIVQAARNLGIPDLESVWSYLRGQRARVNTIYDYTEGAVHRGIEWNIPLDADHRHLLISETEKPGFVRGLPSARRNFYAFQVPPVRYLCIKEQFRRGNAFDRPWDKPKVVMNAKRKSRTPWRIAAFADKTGLICYQTFTCLWPKEAWQVGTLAAVLNGPVANAFIAAREGNRDITSETIKEIPVPPITKQLVERVDSLVEEYLGNLTRSLFSATSTSRNPSLILRDIDAEILKAYDLPSRLERELLDYFNGNGVKRAVPFDFGDYFPGGYGPHIPLWLYLSPEYQRCTAEDILAHLPKITDPELLEAIREME